MKPSIFPPHKSIAVKLGGVGRNLVIHPKMKMKPPLHKIAAFSLVEVTLALGVAAFALLAILAMVPTSLKRSRRVFSRPRATRLCHQSLRICARILSCRRDSTVIWRRIRGTNYTVTGRGCCNPTRFISHRKASKLAVQTRTLRRQTQYLGRRLRIIRCRR